MGPAVPHPPPHLPLLSASSVLGVSCVVPCAGSGLGGGWLRRALKMAGRRNKREEKQWKKEVRGAVLGKPSSLNESRVEDI